MSAVLILVLALVLAKLAVQLLLEWLNQSEVQKHSDQVPSAFADSIPPDTYRKAVAYTLAKSRLSQVELVYNTGVLILLLLSGWLPALWNWHVGQLGASAASLSAWLLLVLILFSLPSLPLDWIDQFRLEQRFGFNTSTQRTWWMDRIKGLGLTLVIGYPLLLLILKLVEWIGPLWWVWAWATILLFQLLMVVLAPILILPLFNKLTALPDGPLKERLLKLGERTGFTARSILVMDGSKRSRHSNAFFTGFGRFRKIVLFDTLIEQLQPEELEAVLAHEIGHYKRAHIPKMLIGSAAGMLLGFFIIAQLAGQPAFYRAFGFEPGSIVPALLLFSLLSGVVTFWISPLVNLVSRRFEYQADAFAVQVMTERHSLIGALRKLTEKNLSNLTPHPLYSGFYYSHPTLPEREAAMARVSAA